jgi:hypothetical protein
MNGNLSEEDGSSYLMDLCTVLKIDTVVFSGFYTQIFVHNPIVQMLSAQLEYIRSPSTPSILVIFTP